MNLKIIKKIDNNSITIEMGFEEYAVLRGYEGISEMMKCYGINDEREAVVQNAKMRCGFVDND